MGTKKAAKLLKQAIREITAQPVPLDAETAKTGNSIASSLKFYVEHLQSVIGQLEQDAAEIEDHGAESVFDELEDFWFKKTIDQFDADGLSAEVMDAGDWLRDIRDAADEGDDEDSMY